MQAIVDLGSHAEDPMRLLVASIRSADEVALLAAEVRRCCRMCAAVFAAALLSAALCCAVHANTSASSCADPQSAFQASEVAAPTLRRSPSLHCPPLALPSPSPLAPAQGCNTFTISPAVAAQMFDVQLTIDAAAAFQADAEAMGAQRGH